MQQGRPLDIVKALRIGIYLTRGTERVARACEQVPGAEVQRHDSVASLLASLASLDAVVIQNATYGAEFATAVRRCPDLRWIQSAASGTDAFVKHGLPSHVALTTAGDLWANGVADHAMGLLLSLMRAIPLAEQLRSRRAWDVAAMADQLMSPRGKRLLIVGFGAIGRCVAARAQSFGMKIEAVTRTPSKAIDRSHVEAVYSTEELSNRLAHSDVVALTLPLTAESRHLIDRDRLALLQPASLLINVSRGEVVDEVALIEALNAGRLAGAGIDVAATEPLPPSSPLWTTPRLLITPHIASLDDGAGFDALGELCRENMTRFMAGQTMRNRTGKPA